MTQLCHVCHAAGIGRKIESVYDGQKVWITFEVTHPNGQVVHRFQVTNLPLDDSRWEVRHDRSE